MPFSRSSYWAVSLVLLVPGLALAQCNKGSSQGGGKKGGPGTSRPPMQQATSISMQRLRMQTPQFPQGLPLQPQLMQGLPQQQRFQQPLGQQPPFQQALLEQQQLLKLGLNQKHQQAMQVPLAQQQQEWFNSLAKQQTEESLRNALSHANALVRRAAAEELARRDPNARPPEWREPEFVASRTPFVASATSMRSK